MGPQALLALSLGSVSQHRLPREPPVFPTARFQPRSPACAVTQQSIGERSWTTADQQLQKGSCLYFFNPALFPTPVHSEGTPVLALGAILSGFFQQ